MNNNRLNGAIGLCMKAGKCVSGEFAVEKALQKGSILLLILDAEASELTKKKYRNASEYRSVDMIYMKDPGAAIGKPERKILGITDINFKNMILKAMNLQEE